MTRTQCSRRMGLASLLLVVAALFVGQPAGAQTPAPTDAGTTDIDRRLVSRSRRR